jgi:hypothetical protein
VIYFTIVPELGTADHDNNKVRDVVGIYRVNISHEYDYVVVAFEINTNLEQVTDRSVVWSGQRPFVDQFRDGFISSSCD